MKDRAFALAALVWCGGACGGAETWEPGRSTAPLPPREARERRTCASDLTCPLGFVCAKKAGASTGDCARSVDENGAPVFVPHGSDSYGPGASQCIANGDCPPKFVCDDGRCIR
jgi:hypothetical protein